MSSCIRIPGGACVSLAELWDGDVVCLHPKPQIVIGSFHCIFHYPNMGGRQNYDPFLGTLNIRCRIILGNKKGTIILTTTHIAPI